MSDRADDELCSCCNDDPNTVCNACGNHACWAGDVFCADFRTAGSRHQHPQDRAHIEELRQAFISNLHEIDRLRQLLRLARGALLTDGYFTPEQVGDDIAPRIIERLSEFRQQRRAALALIDDLLRPWNTGRRVHPGYEGVEAGFQYRRHVDEWNARRAALGAADEPTTGGPRVSIPMEQLHSHTPYVIDVVNSERQRAEREHYNRETARLLGSTVADVEPTTGGGSDA